MTSIPDPDTRPRREYLTAAVVVGGGETIDPWDAGAQGQAQSGSDWIPAPTGAVVVAIALSTLLAARIGAGDR